MSVFTKLKEGIGFTDAEKKIADYLLANQAAIESLTISRLTQATYTSNASVMRLCKKLGVQGFRELRHQMIKESERKRKTAKPVSVNYPFLPTDGAQRITGAIADLMLETIQSMKELPLEGELTRLAKWISEARHLYYFSTGDTLLTLKGFINRLIKLGIQAIQADENKEMPARIRLMGEGDLFLCVSYSGGHLPEREELAEMAKRNVRTVLITADRDAAGFDAILLLPCREHAYNEHAYSEREYHEKISTFYSQTAIFYLLNCTYSLIYTLKRSPNPFG